jgi:signal transduction histidine kinase
MKELLAELKQNPAFTNVPEEQLSWMIEKGEIKTFAAGENVSVKGTPITYMVIVLEGALSIKAERNGQFLEVSKIERGGITGALPYSRAKLAAGFVFAVGNSKLFFLEKNHFTEMIQSKYELAEALVHLMSDRVREFTKRDMHNEKLMALGKISAGLAHELNNPSSAVVRAASELKTHLGAVPEKFKRVISIRVTNEQVDVINDLLFSKLKNKENVHLTLMERTEKEDEISSWLDEHKIEEIYSLAPTFVEFRIDINDLEKILSTVGKEYLSPVLDWIDNNLITEKLLIEIKEASERINNLVTSIKSYSQMDKAPDKQPADVRKGIESTITMLGHKIKNKNINVEFDLNNVPEIQAYVGELNQVWTNLIDNAIDAMDKNGILKITSEHDKEFLVIKIIDNGPGIPEEIQSMIFDPFFSTKKFGEGTGLGLDIVQRILSKHQAQIKVKSRPGETEFKLCFPLLS